VWDISGQIGIACWVLATMQTAALVLDAAGRACATRVGRTSNSCDRCEGYNGQGAEGSRPSYRRAANPVAPAGTVLRLSRAASWIVLIASFTTVTARSANREVLCLMRGPDSDWSPPERHLVSVFGLTAAEARVALAIAQGKSVEVIAQEFGVSRNTVRNQRQQVLSKKGAERQARLVRLILSLPVASG
jgi:DNA-binding CsgD family transcriptional regulator